jgi:pyridinium-3,5-biscarboxylic acid mononucleotide sulfurtransferase
LITSSVLEQVARAEEWVSARGYRRVRVRVAGRHARVEVDPDQVARLQVDALPLQNALLGLGFSSVEIDPNGYRARSNA